MINKMVMMRRLLGLGLAGWSMVSGGFATVSIMGGVCSDGGSTAVSVSISSKSMSVSESGEASQTNGSARTDSGSGNRPPPGKYPVRPYPAGPSVQ